MNLANLLTLFRFLLVIGMVFFFIPLLGDNNWFPIKINLLYTSVIAFGCYSLAALTDLLDGIVARKYNQVTKIGTFLDPLADKALVLSFFFLVWLYPLIRYFFIFFILISIREILITFLRLYSIQKGIPLKTESHGKLKTNFQIICQFILWAMVLVINFFDEIDEIKVKKLISQSFLLEILFYLPNLLLFITTVITVHSGVNYFFNKKTKTK